MRVVQTAALTVGLTESLMRLRLENIVTYRSEMVGSVTKGDDQEPFSIVPFESRKILLKRKGKTQGEIYRCSEYINNIFTKIQQYSNVKQPEAVLFDQFLYLLLSMSTTWCSGDQCRSSGYEFQTGTGWITAQNLYFFVFPFDVFISFFRMFALAYCLQPLSELTQKAKNTRNTKTEELSVIHQQFTGLTTSQVSQVCKPTSR